MSQVRQPLFVILGLAAAFVAFRVVAGAGGTSEDPAVLAAAYHTLGEGTEASKASGKPMFVLVTADWCGPCQGFKARTLADPSVESYLTQNHEVVKVDVTERTHNVDAQYLGVRSIPAGFILWPDGYRQTMPGQPAPGEFVAWARTASATR